MSSKADGGARIRDDSGVTREADGRTPSLASSPPLRMPPATPSTSPPPPPAPDPQPARPLPSAPGPARIRRSRWWYLLPIFLDIAGGVIAYFVLRHDDPQRARNCLALGAALFAMHLLTYWLLWPDLFV